MKSKSQIMKCFAFSKQAFLRAVFFLASKVDSSEFLLQSRFFSLSYLISCVNSVPSCFQHPSAREWIFKRYGGLPRLSSYEAKLLDNNMVVPDSISTNLEGGCN